MKKILIALIAVLSCVGASFAQEVKEPESKSKAIEFLSKDGSFLLKEFYDLPKVGGVECQVLIMKNIVTGDKMGCLRLETKYYSSTLNSSDSYIGTLDTDELDACIQCLTYIKDTLMPTMPDVYTEAQYTTSDGVKFGAYFNKGKWTTFVYTKGYTRRSAEFLKGENIPTFIDVMQQAKTLIAEKTK